MLHLCVAIFLTVSRRTFCAEVTTQYSRTYGPLTIPPDWNVTEEMIKAHIIPDVIDVAPEKAVKIRYSFCGVHFGARLNRLQVKRLPGFINWAKEWDRFYTLIITGPDAPTREKPVNREYVHWLVTNIPGRIRGNEEGETLAEYKVELSDMYGAGDHRIVYLMFQQPTKEKLMFDEHRIHVRSNESLRTHFSTRAFIKKYNLKIIGANYLTLDFTKFDPFPEDFDIHPPECMPDKLIPING